jgi:site-specific recombinase XerD
VAKGNSEKHVRLLQRRLEKIAEGRQLRLLSDIEATRINAWLARQQATVSRFSAQTRNYYLDTIKYFCSWLVEVDRLQRNPLLLVKRIDVHAYRRHDRRALADEEFSRLIGAAESGRVVQGVGGKVGATIYLMAGWTGFRRRELASLTIASLNLGGNPPTSGRERATANGGEKTRYRCTPLSLSICTSTL